MPNWAYSKVTISGDRNEVSRLKEQVSQPYQDPHDPDRTNEGVFLLWNIVKPNNLSAYRGEERAKFDELVGADPELTELNKLVLPDNNSDLVARVIHEMATSDGWYEWNCRNWGTKWDLGEKAYLEYELGGELFFDDTPVETTLEIGYRLESAWSPPVEALCRLSEQYPNVVIDLASIDESDCFAMSANWSNGEFNEQDEDITHEMGMELRGYCNLECCGNTYE